MGIGFILNAAFLHRAHEAADSYGERLVSAQIRALSARMCTSRVPALPEPLARTSERDRVFNVLRRLVHQRAGHANHRECRARDLSDPPVLAAWVMESPTAAMEAGSGNPVLARAARGTSPPISVSRMMKLNATLGSRDANMMGTPHAVSNFVGCTPPFRTRTDGKFRRTRLSLRRCPTGRGWHSPRPNRRGW